MLNGEMHTAPQIKMHVCHVYSTNKPVTHRSFRSAISVHVAQWLEHLTGYQKVTGCAHM